MTKEDIYDRDIFPLMEQVLDICKRHHIAMVASFSIPNDEDPDLVCTSALTLPEFEPPDAFEECVQVLTERPIAFASTVTQR